MFPSLIPLIVVQRVRNALSPLLSKLTHHLTLADHIILGAMGKGEGSTTEEKDEYIKGLKSLIVDLRERKIKDLDAIAEAIARYRLKFLDDASRVLPL